MVNKASCLYIYGGCAILCLMLYPLKLIRRCVNVHCSGKSEIIGVALWENCAAACLGISECYTGRPIILQETHIIFMTAVDKIGLNKLNSIQHFIHKYTTKYKDIWSSLASENEHCHFICCYVWNLLVNLQLLTTGKLALCWLNKGIHVSKQKTIFFFLMCICCCVCNWKLHNLTVKSPQEEKIIGIKVFFFLLLFSSSTVHCLTYFLLLVLSLI